MGKILESKEEKPDFRKTAADKKEMIRSLLTIIVVMAGVYWLFKTFTW